MSRILHALDAWGRRLQDRLLHHVELLGDPESMIGAFIMTVWAILAGMWGGVWGVLIVLAIGWLLHIAAVESGNHVMLWLATAGLLAFVVVASATFFDGLPPVMLAAAGTTTLAHNELVRLNYARRRRAVIDDSAYRASGSGLAIVGAMGVLGVAVADAVGSQDDRSWRSGWRWRSCRRCGPRRPARSATNPGSGSRPSPWPGRNPSTSSTSVPGFGAI